MKSIIVSLVAGMAFALPVAASAQTQNEVVLSADARYCKTLVEHYSNTHQGESLPERSNRAAFCESDPQGSIADITRQLNEERIPVPRP